MYRKLFGGIFCLLGLTACEGSTMTGIMSSWKGASLQEAVTQWGYPNQEQVIAGHRLYHWYDVHNYTPPVTTTGTISTYGNQSFINTTTTGGSPITGQCTRTLEVDKSDIIIATKWSGGWYCPSFEVMRYANWRRKQS